MTIIVARLRRSVLDLHNQHGLGCLLSVCAPVPPHFRTLIQGTRGCYQSLFPSKTNPESSWLVGAFVPCSLMRKRHVSSGLLRFHKLQPSSMCLLILDPRVYMWGMLTSCSKYSWREKKQCNHIHVFFPTCQVLSAWYLFVQSMFVASYKPNPKPLK